MLGAPSLRPVKGSTIEQLKSNSLHARYGAVMELRRIGPSIVESVLPLITSPREDDLTRLAALEAVRPFYSYLGANDLLGLSGVLPTIDSPALKIELIKLLMLCRFIQALPSIRTCLDDHATDERIKWLDDERHRVSTYAQEAIYLLERSV